ncbi:M48 family metallopeptidase [Helicobacter pametensis]|uniref:M48 family metallopeptidase n=1 Tax=Helicobacter pametensis TaxID=95149 RepID=UPI00047F149E|nr:M48 family metallopeptidase [Helicobacter pametensis]
MAFYLVCLYSLCFAIPSLVLNLLQYRHIQKAMQKEAILLSPKDFVEAGIYALEKLRLAVMQDMMGLIVFVLWIFFGLEWINTLLAHYVRSEITHQVLIVFSFLFLSQILSIPFKYYQEMILDKRFGFSHQTMGVFITDLLKGVVLLGVVGGAILYVLIFLMSVLSYWWLWGALFVLGVVLLINFVYPTWIAPLFNSFTPLADSVLQEKIEGLMRSVGFESNGIFVMDASKRDGRLNAYFGGLGKNKRVVLFDTLLEKISTDGLVAILGHELGHFKHKDVVFNVLIQGVFLFAIFYIAGSLPQSLFAELGLKKIPANVLIILFLLAPLISFWFLPLVGFFSRKAEFRADRFGASLSSKKTLAEALIRLVNENKSFPSSHPLYICFHFTHPPLLERLKALDYEA